MAYPISDVPRRIVYSGSAGVGPYAFTFEVLANTDIAVYKNTTLLTLTTDYTVTINTGTGTGTVTLVVAATGADTVTIVGDRAIQRTSDFVTGGDLFANTLNEELDAQTIYTQQVDEKADRAIRSPVTDPTTISMVLPSQTSRAQKLLGFNASGEPTTYVATTTVSDTSLINFTQAGTGAVTRTAQSKMREVVSVKDFGAVGDWNGTSGTDDTAAIQAAINTGNRVYFPAGNYRITAPIYLDGEIILEGDGSTNSIITKTTTTVGTGSNLARAGAVTDSYAKNAILIIRHPNNEFAYDTTIKSIGLHSNGFIVEYGIYAPRTTHTIMEDVQIFQCKYGWYTNDSWLTTFTKVIANCNSVEPNGVPSVAPSSYGWIGSVGFWWANDGTGGGTGTTLNAEQTWARDCSIGWQIYGLDYSALNNCGADNITGTPYNILTSRLTMNGCGSENVKLANFGVITNQNSRLTLNTFRAFDINGAPGCAMLFLDNGCETTLNNCTFDNFATVDGAANIVQQNNAQLFVNNTGLPSNGSGFVSYSGGSQRVNFSSGAPYIISSEVSSFPRYWKGRVRDNEVQERVNKAVASGGTVIATLTSAGGSFDIGVCEFTVSWFDSAFPTGVGISRFLVAVHKEGANYRESVSTVTSAYATNGGAGAPTYTLSRVGNVWSLTMTPQDGDCTVNTITAQMQNMTGITLALP